MGRPTRDEIDRAVADLDWDALRSFCEYGDLEIDLAFNDHATMTRLLDSVLAMRDQLRMAERGCESDGATLETWRSRREWDDLPLKLQDAISTHSPGISSTKTLCHAMDANGPDVFESIPGVGVVSMRALRRFAEDHHIGLSVGWIDVELVIRDCEFELVRLHERTAELKRRIKWLRSNGRK